MIQTQEIPLTPEQEERAKEKMKIVVGRVRRYCRRYNREHKEKRVEYNHRYHQEHPEFRWHASARRWASLTSAIGHFTLEEFRLLCEAFENRCIYCHQEVPLVPDHAIPLSRGGSNSIDNIVPACKSCNSSKGAKTYDEFLEYIACVNTTLE